MAELDLHSSDPEQDIEDSNNVRDCLIDQSFAFKVILS
jgi:hypothetical protein